MNQEELPRRLCRVCTQPASQCTCPSVLCLWCSGDSETNSCEHCGGDGIILPERVIVIPDTAARDVREYLRQNPGLQTNVYNEDGADPLNGLCYPAAEAYYHITGCELDVYCLSWDEVNPKKSGTHWYLRDPESSEFIDLGLPFESGLEIPPFEVGRRRGFMTGDIPSKRTQQVLDDLEFDL